METDVERKARPEKMVATTQLRLALETEDERMKEEQQKERIQFRFDISFSSRNELACPVMGTIFLVNMVAAHLGVYVYVVILGIGCL